MAAPRAQTDLTAIIGGIASKLPALIFLSSLALIIASLYLAQAVLIPVAISLLLTFLLSPVISGLERLGLGRVPSVILIVVLTFSLLGAIAWVITSQLTLLAGELPKYEGNIKQKIADVRAAGREAPWRRSKKLSRK